MPRLNGSNDNVVLKSQGQKRDLTQCMREEQEHAEAAAAAKLSQENAENKQAEAQKQQEEKHASSLSASQLAALSTGSNGSVPGESDHFVESGSDLSPHVESMYARASGVDEEHGSVSDTGSSSASQPRQSHYGALKQKEDTQENVESAKSQPYSSEGSQSDLGNVGTSDHYTELRQSNSSSSTKSDNDVRGATDSDSNLAASGSHSSSSERFDLPDGSGYWVKSEDDPQYYNFVSTDDELSREVAVGHGQSEEDDDSKVSVSSQDSSTSIYKTLRSLFKTSSEISADEDVKSVDDEDFERIEAVDDSPDDERNVRSADASKRLSQQQAAVKSSDGSRDSDKESARVSEVEKKADKESARFSEVAKQAAEESASPVYSSASSSSSSNSLENGQVSGEESAPADDASSNQSAKRKTHYTRVSNSRVSSSKNSEGSASASHKSESKYSSSKSHSLSVAGGSSSAESLPASRSSLPIPSVYAGEASDPIPYRKNLEENPQRAKLDPKRTIDMFKAEPGGQLKQPQGNQIVPHTSSAGNHIEISTDCLTIFKNHKIKNESKDLSDFQSVREGLREQIRAGINTFDLESSDPKVIEYAATYLYTQFTDHLDGNPFMVHFDLGDGAETFVIPLKAEDLKRLKTKLGTRNFDASVARHRAMDNYEKKNGYFQQYINDARVAHDLGGAPPAPPVVPAGSGAPVGSKSYIVNIEALSESNASLSARDSRSASVLASKKSSASIFQAYMPLAELSMSGENVARNNGYNSEQSEQVNEARVDDEFGDSLSFSDCHHIM